MRTRYSLMAIRILGLVFLGSTHLCTAQEISRATVSSISLTSGVTTPGISVSVYGSGFGNGAVVYFGGFAARQTKVVSGTELDVITPYLRPGSYPVEVKSASMIARSNVTFTAEPSQVDSQIDTAVDIAKAGQTTLAVNMLDAIFQSSNDYQVRAFTHYQEARIYFAAGLWNLWAGEAASIFLDADKSGDAVQTFWQYHLEYAKSLYFANANSDANTDLKFANAIVERDITQSAEPRFYRGLVGARYGDLVHAKADSDFLLLTDSSNASYQALAAYVRARRGDFTALLNITPAQIGSDGRALGLLGEASFLAGDNQAASQWWSAAFKADPIGWKLSCLAGKKHAIRNNKSVARALLTGCTVMGPGSPEAAEASNILSGIAPH